MSAGSTRRVLRHNHLLVSAKKKARLVPVPMGKDLFRPTFRQNAAPATDKKNLITKLKNMFQRQGR